MCIFAVAIHIARRPTQSGIVCAHGHSAGMISVRVESDVGCDTLSTQDVRSVVRQRLLPPDADLPASFALRIPMSNVDFRLVVCARCVRGGIAHVIGFSDRSKTLADLKLTSAAAVTVVEL
jgi:hypothetical protein